MSAKRFVLVLALALVLEGCVTSQPLAADETFRFALTSRGTGGERTLLLDASADFSQIGSSIALDDMTTTDDSINAIRRIRISGLRPQTGKRGAPTTGHIEFRELAARGTIELVLEYKGHRDLYHVSMRQGGGVATDPPSGEFSRLSAR